MDVAWVTQRFVKLDENIFDENICSQSQASMFDGFGSENYLDKVCGIVEYSVDIHKADAKTCPRTLPDELLVDGKLLTFRRYTDYVDNTTLRRIGSREWTFESTTINSTLKVALLARKFEFV